MKHWCHRVLLMLQLKCYVFMCTDTSPVWVLIHLYTWGAAFRMWTWLLWFVCCPVFVHCPAFWMLTLLLHWFQSSFNKSTPLSTVNHLSHVPHLRFCFWHSNFPVKFLQVWCHLSFTASNYHPIPPVTLLSVAKAVNRCQKISVFFSYTASCSAR